MLKIFATWCMVLPGDPSTIDIHSDDYVKQHFYGVPLKKFLRAIKTAKTAATILKKHLDFVNDGEGHPEEGKLPVCLRYSASPAHPTMWQT